MRDKNYDLWFSPQFPYCVTQHAICSEVFACGVLLYFGMYTFCGYHRDTENTRAFACLPYCIAATNTCIIMHQPIEEMLTTTLRTKLWIHATTTRLLPLRPCVGRDPAENFIRICGIHFYVFFQGIFKYTLSIMSLFDILIFVLAGFAFFVLYSFSILFLFFGFYWAVCL